MLKEMPFRSRWWRRSSRASSRSRSWELLFYLGYYTYTLYIYVLYITIIILLYIYTIYRYGFFCFEAFKSSPQPWPFEAKMKLARRRAAERLDMTPMQLMEQHNRRCEKEKKLFNSSRELSHLVAIGTPFWAHFTRGDPYAEFQRDKGLRRVATAPSQMPMATEPKGACLQGEVFK